MKRTYLLVFYLGMALNGHAQIFEWDVGFHGFADNREYVQSGRESQTIIGLRLAPTFGIFVDSTHRIRVGGDLLHEFGSRKAVDQIDPIIYYQFHKPKFDFFMGVMPRDKIVGDISEALLNDTLAYFDPHISGLLWRYQYGHVQQRVWLDWVSSQGFNKREQFRVGTAGEISLNRFYLSHQAILWHYALSENAVVDQHIRDNLSLRAVAGFRLNSLGFIDSLDLSAGLLLSVDRLRNVYDWRTPKGGIVNVHATHRDFFIEDEFYIGEPHYIPNGVDFYREKIYNRLDLGWAPLKNKRIRGTLIFRFHFTPNGIDNQQVLSLRYQIGGDLPNPN